MRPRDDVGQRTSACELGRIVSVPSESRLRDATQLAFYAALRRVDVLEHERLGCARHDFALVLLNALPLFCAVYSSAETYGTTSNSEPFSANTSW